MSTLFLINLPLLDSTLILFYESFPENPKEEKKDVVNFQRTQGHLSALTLVIAAVQTIIRPQQKGRLFPPTGSFCLVCNLFLHRAPQLFINCKWELRLGRALCSYNDSVRRPIL